jgi:general secretion pathway protein H
MLVTLFVIVIISSLVTINISSGGRDIQLEAQVRRLMDVASYALDEAQLTGVDYGLLLLRQESNGETVYRCSWREFRDQVWRVPASGKEVFSDIEFASDIELQLELEGLAVAALSASVEAEEAIPQVILYSSGETTIGAMDVRGRSDGELLWRLEWDLLGRFDMLRQGIPEDEGL